MARLSAPVADTHGISLPARYTIRPIDASLAEWAKALMVQGFLLRPSLWQPLLPEPKVASALRAFTAMKGHFEHAINSGLSYAIVDSAYTFQRPESIAAGGGLYWDELDPDDPDFESNGKDKMVDRLDFPLVCIALSVDALDRRPDEATKALYDFMPLVRSLGAYLSERGRESEHTWEAVEFGELLLRSGCVTKPGYEGQGLMTALNHFVMLEAKARAYKAISVGVGNPTVFRNWLKAPPGCHSRVVARIDVSEIELEDEEGQLIHPYANSDMSKKGWLIWCGLD